MNLRELMDELMAERYAPRNRTPPPNPDPPQRQASRRRVLLGLDEPDVYVDPLHDGGSPQ